MECYFSAIWHSMKISDWFYIYKYNYDQLILFFLLFEEYLIIMIYLYNDSHQVRVYHQDGGNHNCKIQQY